MSPASSCYKMLSNYSTREVKKQIKEITERIVRKVHYISYFSHRKQYQEVEVELKTYVLETLLNDLEQTDYIFNQFILKQIDSLIDEETSDSSI